MSLQNLFVAKLPRNVTDADLQHIFDGFEPTSAKVMLDAATGKSKGFGFVLFPSEEAGSKAYRALNRKSTRACGHNFTLVIYPSKHDGKAASESSNALYIRNIPMTVTQECVEQFLRSFGTLTYCAMREDHHGCPVWVVYAEYATVNDAKHALQMLHGNSTYFHGTAPILAKFEDSDDAKRQRRQRREERSNSSRHGASHDSRSTSMGNGGQSNSSSLPLSGSPRKSQQQQQQQQLLLQHSCYGNGVGVTADVASDGGGALSLATVAAAEQRQQHERQWHVEGSEGDERRSGGVAATPVDGVVHVPCLLDSAATSRLDAMLHGPPLALGTAPSLTNHSLDTAPTMRSSGESMPASAMCSPPPYTEPLSQRAATVPPTGHQPSDAASVDAHAQQPPPAAAAAAAALPLPTTTLQQQQQQQQQFTLVHAPPPNYCCFAVNEHGQPVLVSAVMSPQVAASSAAAPQAPPPPQPLPPPLLQQQSQPQSQSPSSLSSVSPPQLALPQQLSATPVAVAPASMVSGLHLLTPHAANTIVLLDGQRQFVVSKNAVNLHRQPLQTVVPPAPMLYNSPAGVRAAAASETPVAVYAPGGSGLASLLPFPPPSVPSAQLPPSSASSSSTLVAPMSYGFASVQPFAMHNGNVLAPATQ